MRVLIIEDDEKISGFVKRGLQEAGFAVDQAKDGRTGLHLALTESYDAAIVDPYGLAILDTNPAMNGKPVPHRPPLSLLRDAGFRHQLRLLYAPAPSTMPASASKWPGSIMPLRSNTNPSSAQRSARIVPIGTLSNKTSATFATRILPELIFSPRAFPVRF